jgi:hypothetical protein
VTIPNPNVPSGSATRFNPAKEAEKSTYLIDLNFRKPLMVFIFQRGKALRLDSVAKNDNFKSRPERGIFKCISWLNGSVFIEVMSGFYE